MAAQSSSDVIDTPAVDSTPLATPTLQDLSNELNSVADWHSLGVKLGVQSHELTTIEKDHHGDSVRCKHEMLVRWLHSAKRPTWKGVADALWQMEERAVAVKIQTKYCSSSTDTVPQMSELTLAEQTRPQGGAETQMTGSRSPLCTVSNLSSPPPPSQAPVVLVETSPPYLHSVPQMSVWMQTQQTQPQGGTEAQMGPPLSLSKVPDYSSPPQHTLQPAVTHGVPRHQVNSDLALARPSMSTVGYCSSPIGHGETSPPLYLDSVASGHQEPLRRVASGHQEPSKAAVFARENHQAIKDKFAAFQTNVCSKLLKSGVDTEEFRLHVINQFPPGKCIPPPPANLTEMFKAITYHGLWDYFHYSPLVRIAKRFGAGDPEIESWVQTYKKDVKAYSVVAKLEDYVESDVDVTAPQPANRAKYDPHYYTQVEWKTEFIDHSLQYLTEVWELFSSHYLMPDSPPTALLHRIYEGCFSVTWLVPSGLIPQLIKSTKSDSAFYQQHRILRVTVRDECIYEEETTLDPKQLFQACEQGDLEVVHRFLAAGIDVEIKDARNWTPLYITSKKGHDRIVTQLLKRGADVNYQDEFGQAPLWTASLHGHSHIAELLLASGANPDVQKEDGCTALYSASFEGYTGIVESLLLAGANPDIQEKDGWSALMATSEHGHQEIARLLIGRGANLNCQNKDQDTALTIASYHGKIEVVKQLLAAGALTDIQAYDGRTALALASWNGHLSVVKELVEKGADPNIQDQEGLTALILAIKQGHTEIVQQLVDHAKADLNIQEQSTGWTALFFAAKDDDLDLTRLLIKSGATVELKDKNDVTALDVARTFGYESICQELQTHMGRQHEQQKTSNEMKELVLSARKFLQTMFSRVGRSILKTRTLKREMTGNMSYSAHEGPKTMHITLDK